MLYKACITSIPQSSYYAGETVTKPSDSALNLYVDSNDLKKAFETTANISWKTTNPLTASEDAADLFAEIEKKKGKTLGKIQEIMLKAKSNIGGMANTLTAVATGQAFINTDLYYAYEKTNLTFNGLDGGLKLHSYFTVSSSGIQNNDNPKDVVLSYYNDLNGVSSNGDLDKDAWKNLPLSKRQPGPTEIEWSIAAIRQMSKFASNLSKDALNALSNISEYADASDDKKRNTLTGIIKETSTALVGTYSNWMAGVSDEVAKMATDKYKAFYIWIKVNENFIRIGPFITQAASATFDMSNIDSNGDPLHAVLNIETVEFLGKAAGGDIIAYV